MKYIIGKISSLFTEKVYTYEEKNKIKMEILSNIILKEKELQKEYKKLKFNGR